jgi:hypothetical protein
MSLVVTALEDLSYLCCPSSMCMNPWRVLEKIARHDGGRLSNSRGLSAHMPLRFEVISALAIARRERNGCDCLSLAQVTRVPEANVMGKGFERQTHPSEYAPRFTESAMDTVCW